jgi:hypothetical protein
MTTPTHFPGPRDGLDEGSLAELAQNGREIAVERQPQESRHSGQSGRRGQSRPWVASMAGPIDVPEDACALIDGLAAYGV